MSRVNDNDEIFRSGAQLLAEWGCKTREQKLERAVMALMDQLNEAHKERKECDLAEHLADENVSCSCADAYRMGHEALGTGEIGQLIAKYSPNIAWGKQRVEIVLMQWAYTATFPVEVGGNCHGMSVIDCAIGILFDSLLPEGDEVAAVKLTNDKGNTLQCEDDEGRGDQWLKNMVVSAKIVAYTPPTLNEVRAMFGAKPVKDGDRPWQPR